ncbi:hypothetical protein M3223_04225 [Paenibacillus pasadenensis]|uniref:DUF6906 family protein n=1 Tax=Paenibacillus pasadenensis TaxID=217090 RepID=UPI002041B2F0|nr:hypothetical protein [Paenibacillus pasadenensis]MCM3746556.1 hypothetical protein [Paenibacillus pasadenensis]
MAAGKRPTVKQRTILKSNGLDWAHWLILKDLNSEMVIKHRYTDRERTVFK